MSQKDDILNALRRGDRLTSLECHSRFGCNDTSKRMNQLRRDGWPIPPAKMYCENGHKFGVWEMTVKEADHGQDSSGIRD